MKHLFLTVNEIKKTYGSDTKINALSKISYSFPNKGLISIVGRSGCGKTTFLQTLAGLIKIDDGEIDFKGRELSKLSEGEWENFRNLNVGIVFQDYQLFENDSVEKNLKLVLDIRKNISDEDKLVSRSLDYVGLSGYQKRRVQNLSGGEKQRVAIARAIIKSSKYILADEPTGHLDNNTGKEIWQLLKKVSYDRLVIVVTHDKDSARQYSNCMLHMEDGKISEIATTNNNLIRISQKNGNDIITSPDNKTDIINYLFEALASGEKDFHIDNVQQETDYVDDNSEKSEKIGCENAESGIVTSESTDKVKGMSIDKILDFAYGLITKRKIRKCLTVIMLGLSFLVSLAVFTIFDYDPYIAIKKYVDDYGYSVFRIGKDVSYVDAFFQVYGDTVYSGNYIDENLRLGFSEENCMGVKTKCKIEKENGTYMDDIQAIYSNGMKTRFVDGKWAEDGNEIVLTDYLALMLNVRKGEKVLLDGRELFVCGIMTTDFAQYGYLEKKTRNELSDISFYKYKMEYGCVVVSKDFMIEEPKVIDVAGSDFLYSEKLSRYVSSMLSFASYKQYDGQLLYGKEIADPELEVIISNEMLFHINNNSGADSNYSFDDVCKEYEFVNLYDDKFNNFYSNMINVYDLFPNGIKIVGVVDSIGQENVPQIFISEEKWNELENQFRYFYFDEIWVECDSQCLTYNLKELDLRLDEPHALEILAIADTMKELKIISIVALIIVLLLSSIMLVTSVSFSIEDSLHGLGILRSLGVRKKDTVKIFFVENAIITMAAFVVSCVMYFCALSGVNRFVRNRYVEYAFDLFVFLPHYLAIVCFIAFASTMLLVFIPVSKYSRKKIAELLHETI